MKGYTHKKKPQKKTNKQLLVLYRGKEEIHSEIELIIY